MNQILNDLKKLSFFIIFAALLGGCHGRWDSNPNANTSTSTSTTISISGKVTDHTSGQPLDSAKVQITSPSQFTDSTQTDSTGTFSLKIKSSSLQSSGKVSIALKASKNKYNPKSMTLKASAGTDTTGVNFSLPRQSGKSFPVSMGTRH